MIRDGARGVANDVATPDGRVQGAANWAKMYYKYNSINNQLDQQ